MFHLLGLGSFLKNVISHNFYEIIAIYDSPNGNKWYMLVKARSSKLTGQRSHHESYVSQNRPSFVFCDTR